MHVRADTRDKLTGVRLLRLLASLGAKHQVFLYGIAKRGLQFGNGLTLERNHIPSVDDFTVENADRVVVFDAPNVALVFHHGVTPASVRNRRMERKAPFSISFCG